MRQSWTALAIAASVGMLADTAWGQSTFEDTAIRRLLGKDYEGAKIAAVQDKRIVTVELKTRKIRVLASLDSSSSLSGGPRPCWSPDGTQVLYVRGGKAYVVPAAGGRPSLIPTHQATV